MGKTKTIAKKQKKSNVKLRKEVKKGGLKSGINPVGEMESRRNLYLIRVAESKSNSKKEIAALINAQKERLFFESELAAEELQRKQKAITDYATEHNCSRKVARKLISRSKRLEKKAA